MHFSLYLTLCSFIYLQILFLIYLFKKNHNYLRCRIYKFLLLYTIVFSVMEFVSILFLASDKLNAIGNIIFLIRWLASFPWVSLVCIYYIVATDKNKYLTMSDMMKRKSFMCSCIMMILLMIIYFFIPHNSVSPNDLIHMIGGKSYYTLGFMLACVITLTIHYFISEYKTKEAFATLVFYNVFGGAAMIVQVFFPYIDILSLFISASLFMIYATLENPTLDLLDDLKEIKKEIDKSSKVKTDVLLSMSHDIRSPMNAIVNYGSNIEELNEINNIQLESDINNIIVSGKNLLNIIGDVLDISSSNKDSEANQETYELSVIMDDLLNITKSRIGSKKIKLNYQIDPNVPKKLKGNSTKVYRIIMNILSNSAKYTDVGQINISITSSSEKNDEDVMLHFVVSDTGFGIKDSDKGRVFSEFGRLKDATNQNIEGTGLGLVNTRNNVINLGGRIWFESVYGAGTKFYIDLPQKISNDVLTNDKSKDLKDKSKLLDCKKMNALIVDDNKLNVKVMTRLLERYGFKVHNAIDGETAIDQIKEEKMFDIIFMDISLLGIDGIQTMKILKQLTQLYDIPPIVALTTNAISGARNTYISEGFDEYLSKPIDLYELDRIINMYFGNSFF